MSDDLDLDLFGQAVLPVPPAALRKRKSPTPSPIGSGPPGETCRSCRYRYRRDGGSKSFFKCAWIPATNGAGTDIKLKWASCAQWDPRWPLLEHYLKGIDISARIGHWRVIGLPPETNQDGRKDRLLLTEWYGSGEQIFEGPNAEAQAIAWLRAKIASVPPNPPFN